MSQIPLDELASLPSFYLPSLSYDRRHIAFYWDKTGQLELYILETRPNAKPQKVSDGNLPRALHAGFCWSRDSKYIYFAKDNDGDENHNIWRLELATSKTERLTNNPQAAEYPIEVSPDNKSLLVLSNLYGQLSLLALNLETFEYRQLTNYPNPVANAAYSPDGKQIAYLTNETENFKNIDLYLMNADGSNQRRVWHVAIGSEDIFSQWSPDGKHLAVSSDAGGKTRMGLFDLESQNVKWLSPEDVEEIPDKFSPDGKRLLGYRNEDSMLDVIAYNVETGEEISIELPPGLSYNAGWLSNERIMTNIMTSQSRPELRDYNLLDGESNVLIAAEYGSIDPKLFVGHDYVWYPSSDGTMIPAILYRPRNLEKGKKYPALVEVHGGPTGQFFRGFSSYSQFLADHGYIVLQPNPRGSTGYGVAFRDAALKDWGGIDLEDIAAGATYLRSLDEVDSERIAVWGGSYGGYMTYMAVTKKPELWKAGVAWVGITDLIQMYDDSMEHYKYFLREQMGDPVTDADLWRDRSAINFAHQMTAKLMIIHGVNDPRCPINQARLFRDKLLSFGKVEGKDFEYIELEEEGHGSTDIQQKIRGYHYLVDFLGRNL
jgi:dipeptidyl aminopeptidase/acylaminoacyl peptidase